MVEMPIFIYRKTMSAKRNDAGQLGADPDLKFHENAGMRGNTRMPRFACFMNSGDSTEDAVIAHSRFVVIGYGHCHLIHRVP
jgi:hypothetical protein